MEGVAVSVLTGEGLALLRTSVAERIFGVAGRHALPDLEGVLVRERHRLSLARARDAVVEARPHLGAGGDAALAAHQVRRALAAVDELIGVVDTDEVLGRIFSRFCVGSNPPVGPRDGDDPGAVRASLGRLSLMAAVAKRLVLRKSAPTEFDLSGDFAFRRGQRSALVVEDDHLSLDHIGAGGLVGDGGEGMGWRTVSGERALRRFPNASTPTVARAPVPRRP